MTFWGEVALWIKQLREESGRRNRNGTPLKRHERFRYALFGTIPAGIALPYLTFDERFDFIKSKPDQVWKLVPTLSILLVYVVAIAIIVSWKNGAYSPVRTFLSGLLLSCFTWAIIEFTFLRNSSGG